MFPCHFKIPGHSGTDFKHRKAFRKLNKRLKKLKRTNASLRKPASNSTNKKILSFTKTGVNLPIKWLVALLQVTMFGLVFLLVLEVGRSFSDNLIASEQNSKGYHTELLNTTYENVMIRADDYLEKGELDAAREQYFRALRIKQYAFGANLGMTKTLLKKCKRSGQYCGEAKAYFNFMIKNTNLTDIELNEMETLYVAR